MITELLEKMRKSGNGRTVPHIPAGQRVYCVGDIHGRADLLQQLHTTIGADAAAAEAEAANTIVYLGDYIDRGEQSRQVIELLLSEPLAGFESVYLQGNHEQSMMNFIQYPEAAAAWLTFGGREALNSYGITLTHIPSRHEIVELAKHLDSELPAEHREFLNKLLDSWRCGSYYFVHAGIQPGVALDKQRLEDQLWIREDFLGSSRDHGAIIVHGHSISLEPQLLPNRIGIDTGAFVTGVLTCVVLEGEQQRILQTGTHSDI